MRTEELLRAYNIPFTKEGNGDFLKVKCPYHNDNKPSGSVTRDAGKFHCWACSHNATFVDFLAKSVGKGATEMYYEMQRGVYTEKDSLCDPVAVERAFKAIFDRHDLRAELYHRCVTDELIQKYRIGFFGNNRVSIPIPNRLGDYVNIRLYDPKAAQHNAAKFVNAPGNRKRGPHIFPIDQLRYDILVLCGGELKAVVAADELNPYNIGAVCLTLGEDDWDNRLTYEFKDKIVYVCNDVDDTGVRATEKRCRILKPVATQVYPLYLPLDKDKYPKGDINDYKRTGGLLLPLINEAKVYEPPEVKEVVDNEEPEGLSLEESVAASNAKRKFLINATVSSMDTSPYSLPKDVVVRCTRESDFCAMCPIFMKFDGTQEQKVAIKDDSFELLEMVGKENKKQLQALQAALKIPRKCREHDFDIVSFHNVEEIRISAPLDIHSRSTEKAMQLAFCVGPDKVELNESYTMTGRMHPHPDTQQATLLINKYQPMADALSTYEPGDVTHLCKMFNPGEWSFDGIKEKLDEIYHEFSANVTRIHGRPELHLITDLAYHSPLFFHFIGQELNGWAQVLIVGDSSQGKSETVRQIQDYYSLGAWVECKAASAAGLLGGIDEQGRRRFISWGEIPNNDRRLVVLDELKGMSRQVLASTTSMRSTGIAEITKIVKRKTHARTRIIGISNPRDERSLRSFNYGIEAALHLIGASEDLRRFDAAIIVDERDITIEQTQAIVPRVTEKYPASLCSELVLLAWTIPHTRFEDEMHVLKTAALLCDKYSESIPLVDRGSMRFKLAKLSAALAMRTASVENNNTVFIRNCHVDYISHFLQSMYDRDSCGYSLFSKKQKEQSTLDDEAFLRNEILSKWPYPKKVVDWLLSSEELTLFGLQDMCAWEKETAREAIAMLLRQRAITSKRSSGSPYIKTTAFITFLREMKTDVAAPKYLEREERF